MRSRSKVRITLVLAVVVAGIATGILTLAGADSESVPDLACDRVNVAEGDVAPEDFIGAVSPEEAVLQSEWWSIIEVPDEARKIVTDTLVPADGIVAVPVKADGVVTETEAAGGQEFQVYVKSAAVARLSVTKSSNDTYYVSGAAYC